MKWTILGWKEYLLIVIAFVLTILLLQALEASWTPSPRPIPTSLIPEN